MAVSGDMIRAYRAPGRVMARLIASGAGEERALAWLMTGCFLMFVARLPFLSRRAYLHGEEFAALAAGAFTGAVFLAPLVFYALAALSHVAAGWFGGRGSWASARLALFWTVLLFSPLMLFQGMVAGFIGPGAALNLVAILNGAVFVCLWIVALRVAEGLADAAPEPPDRERKH